MSSKSGWFPVFALSLLLAMISHGQLPPPQFGPLPPEPAAAQMVADYLTLLAAGDYEKALTLNDVRGMRQYLLDRRLADLKTRNPELSSKDLADMSAQIQTHELAPARLKRILTDIMQEDNYEGMTWTVAGYALAPEPLTGHVVRVQIRSADGQEKPLLLGIKKLGERWMIAPDLVEAILARQAATQAGTRVTPPAPVVDLAGKFWTHWQEGTLDEAYKLFSPKFRSRISLLQFLQRSQDFLAQIGTVSSWQVGQGLANNAGLLWVAVYVQGEGDPRPVLMAFTLEGETWQLADIQMLAGPRPAAPNASAPPVEKPSLRPDLNPLFSPAASRFAPTENASASLSFPTTPNASSRIPSTASPTTSGAKSKSSMSWTTAVWMKPPAKPSPIPTPTASCWSFATAPTAATAATRNSATNTPSTAASTPWSCSTATANMPPNCSRICSAP